jgi:hypothetical protein
MFYEIMQFEQDQTTGPSVTKPQGHPTRAENHVKNKNLVGIPVKILHVEVQVQPTKEQVMKGPDITRT